MRMPAEACTRGTHARMLPACLLALHFLQARGHSRVPVVRASPNMQPQAARTAVAAAA